MSQWNVASGFILTSLSLFFLFFFTITPVVNEYSLIQAKEKNKLPVSPCTLFKSRLFEFRMGKGFFAVVQGFSNAQCEGLIRFGVNIDQNKHVHIRM